MLMQLLVNQEYKTAEIFNFAQELFAAYLKKQEIWWVLEKIFAKSQVQLLALPKITVQQNQLDLFLKIKDELSTNKPLAYIIGHTTFANLQILTREPILIPRSETEEWCLDLIKIYKNLKIKPHKILDIGTGTGCLALALKSHFPDAQVTACDINNQALLLAQENADINQLNINLVNSNVWENINKQQFDLIVSNPPYIAEHEYHNLQPSVLNFEDKNALTCDDNGLAIIKKIIKNALDYLNVNGLLVIEIDRTQQDISTWAYQQGFKYGTYKKDFNNQARVIYLTNGSIWNLPQLNFITGK
jgi:release factor glutamine methyltransferase